MKFKLDIEDEQFDFNGWAFIHFHTSAPCYEFADALNRLYHYGLHRIDDMRLGDTAWPFYRHEDTVRHLIIFLIERPAAALTAPWERDDKLCIVKGESSEEESARILADFTTTPTYDSFDLLARERAELVDWVVGQFTVANLLDFGQEPPSRKAKKERLQVMQQCDSILAYIEQNHLDLDCEERMRMELLRLLKKEK